MTNLFAPDELAGAALYTDMARNFRDAGHEVRVTTTFPYYPGWRLRPEDRGVEVREESFERMRVRRVGMHVPAAPTGRGRMLSDASFLWSLVRRGKFRGWRPDVVVTACPMLSQCLAQRFLYRGEGVPRLIIVQDFVVDAALELGILKVPGIGGVLRAGERWALRSAATLSTISPEMLEKLAEKIGGDRRLLWTPNWIHSSLMREIECQESAGQGRRERGQLLYSGNVGVKQALPEFVRVFRGISTGWQLRVQGAGTDKANLREGDGVDDGRVSFGEVSDEVGYVASLRRTSACLITQKAGVSANFLPSKLLPALATGTPVLAVCDAASPLGREVAEGGFGAVVAPGDGSGIEAVLRAWDDDPAALEALGQRAKERARRYRAREILGTYLAELERLVGTEVPGALGGEPGEIAPVLGGISHRL
ncbi:WcaI family glycosyltransferase [soil metagenome]